MISIFDIFKIGIGPSSSHTVGPMKAGKLFIDDLKSKGLLESTTKISVDVYGSLSLTGKGHHTDIAIIMGLLGNDPEHVDIEQIPNTIKQVESTQELHIGNQVISFPSEGGLTFHKTNLPMHENGMSITAWKGTDVLFENTYYSIGGGFIVDEAHFGESIEVLETIPYSFDSAAELVQLCKENGLSISTLILENEKALRSEKDVIQHCTNVWQTMKSCIERGAKKEGILPGPLRVPRRAAALKQHLLASERTSNDPMAVVDWVNMYAFAVNEENAAGGRVVTAPTNGACGIVPAVFAYYDKFVQSVNQEDYVKYLATSGAIGGLYKKNASISGAEVGCQGEVGVACSMAAAGLAELLGGSPEQVCMAAEIAMEHNLGLTCDPVAGQVQVPCIERNGIAAVKAINATRMAMRRSSAPTVSLDKVIETMFETGKDMNAKYRETSQGGLAIKVIC
ncbi:L-serine ammonia-lyase [Vibrio sp.]|uniref:L-serine dehydratase n=1 Tax=Vibrio viridaestus TaxID=2487322 RepID=A0A3N9TIC7_9VIBR|nr:L-serine ammonia-lyase [Vibrio viridaestus]MDC0610707.1 L-serine ammonia-lyase [Vibrio sp.]RQW63664.1 L-serine ammonia-lyase [Vibrio viridaestus]